MAAEPSSPQREEGDDGDTPSSAATFLMPKSPDPPLVSPPPGRVQPPPLDIKLAFAQFHGKPPEHEIIEAETLSSLQFNRDGNFIAVGDKGGRVYLYKRDPERFLKSSVNYKPYLTFQSHEPEFDYLKSIEIEEKITQVKWVPRTTSAHFVIASNDKTIKLWRIGERSFNSTENLNLKEPPISNTITSLILPRVVRGSSEAVASLRRVYSNAHTYHINTISVNSDQETFLSADDLRINLWNFEVTDQSFVIVDIKPDLMENLTEVITSSTFHPSLCNLFAYTTSRGVTKLCDMRMSALCDRHSKLFHESQDLSYRGFFSEIVGSISDIQFSNNGRYIGTRDYMTVKIWDTAMENRPLQTIPIHECLNLQLSRLYENDCIFDKFTLSWNAQDSKIVTGSYNHMFGVGERSSGKGSLFEISKDFGSGTHTKPTILKPKRIVEQHSSASLSGPNNNKKSKIDKDEILIEQMDFVGKKVLLNQWHPKENLMAVASNSNLYFFSEKRSLI